MRYLNKPRNIIIILFILLAFFFFKNCNKSRKIDYVNKEMVKMEKTVDSLKSISKDTILFLRSKNSELKKENSLLMERIQDLEERVIDIKESNNKVNHQITNELKKLNNNISKNGKTL